MADVIEVGGHPVPKTVVFAGAGAVALVMAFAATRKKAAPVSTGGGVAPVAVSPAADMSGITDSIAAAIKSITDKMDANNSALGSLIGQSTAANVSGFNALQAAFASSFSDLAKANAAGFGVTNTAISQGVATIQNTVGKDLLTAIQQGFGGQASVLGGISGNVQGLPAILATINGAVQGIPAALQSIISAVSGILPALSSFQASQGTANTLNQREAEMALGLESPVTCYRGRGTWDDTCSSLRGGYLTQRSGSITDVEGQIKSKFASCFDAASDRYDLACAGRLLGGS